MAGKNKIEATSNIQHSTLNIQLLSRATAWAFAVEG
jgi:hypothetical protein